MIWPQSVKMMLTPLRSLFLALLLLLATGSAAWAQPATAPRNGTGNNGGANLEFDRPLEISTGTADPFGSFIELPADGMTDPLGDFGFGDPFASDLAMPQIVPSPAFTGRPATTAPDGSAAKGQTPVPLNYSEVRALMKCPTTGSVVLNILVDRIGRYVRHEVDDDTTTPPQPLLATVEAHVAKLKFKPARIGDVPVDAWVSLPFEFKN